MSKVPKVPDTVKEFLSMTEPAVMVDDPFVGLSTGDKLPGYFGAAGAATFLIGLATKTHSQVVLVACVAGLVLLALGSTLLNMWVVRERHRTLRVHSLAQHTVPDGEPDDVG